ncbi:MAG: SF3a splicing factor complex subunit [Alyxoria varia]|nr:MAG: SF3a splicing factor complex subunit [Alyxoria varia]
MAPAPFASAASPNGVEAEELGVKPPDNVVLPPKDIRHVIEKVAGYVARNGASFEDRIRQKESSNPKFSFLHQNDAYGSFYLWRLEEVRAGRGTDTSAGRQGQNAGPAGAAAAAAAAESEKPKGPEPPPEFHFSARMPNISAQDLDVVKLTAAFVAKNGRGFMTALSQRESTNYQFDFLRPQHSLYQFFSRLVDQYSELLNARGAEGSQAEDERVAEITKNINDRFHLLERARQRAHWVKHQEQQKQKKEEEAEAEKVAYAQVDWHDFVVVETVLFDEADEQTDLPPPTSLSDLQSASLEQKAMMSLQPHDRRIEEAMPTEDMMYQQQSPPPAQPQYRPQPQHSPANFPPPPSNLSPPPQPPSRSPAAAQPFAQPPPLEHNRLASPASAANPHKPPAQNAPMNIRTDYVPRAAKSKHGANTTICPRCNNAIPSDQIEEHMRIELLDPRWKEQRAKAESRYATTNLSTADVANNLKRLASQRTDVFDGVTGEMITEEEKERRKRAAMSYDGVIPGQEGHGPIGNSSFGVPGLKQGLKQGFGGSGPGGGRGAGGSGGWAEGSKDPQAQKKIEQMQTMNIQDQLRHIQEKAKQQ